MEIHASERTYKRRNKKKKNQEREAVQENLEVSRFNGKRLSGTGNPSLSLYSLATLRRQETMISLSFRRSLRDQLSTIQRLQSRQVSTEPGGPPPSTSSSSSALKLFCATNCEDGQNKNSVFRYFLKSAPAVVVGSAIGFLYWSSSEKSFFSHSDWSAAATEVPDPSLEHNPKYLFGGILSLLLLILHLQ